MRNVEKRGEGEDILDLKLRVLYAEDIEVRSDIFVLVWGARIQCYCPHAKRYILHVNCVKMGKKITKNLKTLTGMKQPSFTVRKKAP